MNDNRVSPNTIKFLVAIYLVVVIEPKVTCALFW